MVRYAVTILLGALLLFSVQPQIARFILPWFGGGTAVWSTCMLFFQVLLLGGYAYAHVLTKSLARRSQIFVHCGLLVASFLFLPVVPSETWKPDGSENPIVHILLLLSMTVGLLYLLLAATGPLVQSWFVREFDGRSPYRLYALSNVGSLAALLSFPFLLEPNIKIGLQASVWAWLYVAFAISCGVCACSRVAAQPAPWPELAPVPEPRFEPEPEDDVAPDDIGDFATEDGGGVAVADRSGVAVATRPATKSRTRTARFVAPAKVPSPTAQQRMAWLGLAALPSAMLLAVTNLICQDIAVVPFFWVMPLAIYLLTFILTFDSERWYRPAIMSTALIAAAGFVFIARQEVFFTRSFLVPGVVLAALLFLCGMVCHGELVRRRPHPNHLTGFYLTISLGGAIGGLFVALAAPLLFSTYLEIDIVVLAAVAVAMFATWRLRVMRAAFAVVMVAVVALGCWLRFDDTTPVEQSRNFYGRLAVVEDVQPITKDGGFAQQRTLSLLHGQTIHGRQVTGTGGEPQGMTYYAKSTGVGFAIANHPAAQKRALKIGVIGLGAGTLAFHARKDDHFVFYEIDPDIIRVAGSHFTYLGDARARGATIDVRLGDGRIQLERDAEAEEHPFDILVVDAFSSDAIPVHLLTRECNQLYWQRLASDGLLLVHVSNHHLDLAPIVRGLAEDAGKQIRIISSSVPDLNGQIHSQWAMLTTNREFLDRKELQVSGPSMAKKLLWTDDFSSLWHILR